MNPIKKFTPYLFDKFFIKKPRLRSFVTKAIYGDHLVVVNLLGAQIAINTLKENGYLRASNMARKSSLMRDEFPVMLTLANLISIDCGFIDIGANIGVYASSLAKFQKVYAGFKVFAFEVNPETFSRLKINADEHQFNAFNVGIGSKRETIEFVGGAVSHVTTRVDLANAYNISSNTFSAKIVPLSDFDLPKNLILKIDVEGQEFAVLEGAKDLFDDERISCVYLDGYHDQACWDFLVKYGFEFLDGGTLSKANRETFSLLAIKNL